jgi:hypothetical protein
MHLNAPTQSNAVFLPAPLSKSNINDESKALLKSMSSKELLKQVEKKK